MNRPEVFNVDVDTSECKLSVRMNPMVAAHRAAALLPTTDCDVSVTYQLAELSSVSLNVFSPRSASFFF